MQFELKKYENIHSGFIRILSEQNELALKYLTDKRYNIHTGVHETRKCFKLIRAAAKLVRFSSQDKYHSENTWYCDRSEKLSVIRDAAALIESTKKLIKSCKSIKKILKDLLKLLNKHSDTIIHKENLKSKIISIAKDLSCHIDELKSWNIDNDFSILMKGFRKTYHRGKKALTTAY